MGRDWEAPLAMVAQEDIAIRSSSTSSSSPRTEGRVTLPAVSLLSALAFSVSSDSDRLVAWWRMEVSRVQGNTFSRGSSLPVAGVLPSSQSDSHSSHLV